MLLSTLYKKVNVLAAGRPKKQFVSSSERIAMRYYIPLRAKQPHEEKRPSALAIPLWVWLGAIALVGLVVLLLR